VGVLSHASLDTEIVLALTHLCALLGTQGEEHARTMRTTEAQTTLGSCALALELLGAFLLRARKTEHVLISRADVMARALIVRLFAQQSQFAALMASGDADRFRVGLGLIAEYWRIAREIAGVPKAAQVAAGYAHYWLMFCAHERALELERETPDSSDVDVLARIEHFYALAALESEHAAVAFDGQSRALEFCTKIGKKARESRARVREQRFRWLVITEQASAGADPSEPDKDASAVFFRVPGLFQVEPLALSWSSHVPLGKNDMWARVQTASLAWLQLHGGAEGVKRALRPTAAVAAAAADVDVSQALLSDVPAAVYTTRDRALLAMGRLTERLAWLNHSAAEVPALACELDDLRATLVTLGQLLAQLTPPAT
jgi:hypothetical protein